MLSVQNSVFYRPKDKIVQAERAHKQFYHLEGDHLTLLTIWNQWMEADGSSQWCFDNFIQFRSLKRARDVKEQLLGLMERVEVPLQSSMDSNAILKALTAGYFYHGAKLSRTGDCYRLIKKGHSVYIHPSSSIAPELDKNKIPKHDKELPKFVIYFELVLTSKEYMRVISGIKGEWLLELAPHYYKEKEFEDTSNRKMPKGKGLSRISVE